MGHARIMRRGAAALVLLGAAAVAIATPAAADAIDGNWCHPDGRRLSINGPEVVTPGGNRIEGNYSRHFFSYTIPGNEPAAGSTVYMNLLDESTVYLRVGAEPSAKDLGEEWKRCAPRVS